MDSKHTGLKVIISGGGTGGHVYPAIAIAKALKSLDENIDILFVGATGKLEMEKVPAAGFPIEGLWISGLQRKLTFRNMLFPVKLLSSLIRARSILRRFRPDVVVGVGGYASGPTLEVAHRMGIPTLIQEQNSWPGITNRLLAKKADRICVAFDGMERFFPESAIWITGNPVRKDFDALDQKRLEARRYFGLDEHKKTVLLFGGSLGALSLNESMRLHASFLLEHPDIQVLWQCGKLYFDRYKSCETAQLPNVQLREYLDAMDLAYAAADVLITRAGAMTIAELCVVGKPAILIPSPNVAEDHQTKNAQALVEKDAAILLPDSRRTDMLVKALEILNSKEMAAQLGDNIRKLARPDADVAIAREVMDLGKKSS